jgi:membrane protein YqaA with SNARE-associated domain
VSAVRRSRVTDVRLVADYALLFGWSFLAATVLPLGSEVAFAAVVFRHEQWLLPIAVATAGNALGAFTTYWLGAKAAGFAAEHGAPSSRARRAAGLLNRYGRPAVFFCWVPILGDALAAAAGASKMPLVPFAAWMVAGKAFRYAMLAWSVLAVA